MNTPPEGKPAAQGDATPSLAGDALVLHPRDNVATALCPLDAGRTVHLPGTFPAGSLLLREPIAMCHKFALRDIAADEPIIKYGESIGLATQAIRSGEHVHVHNLVSARAR